MKLFLDDTRDFPTGYVGFRDYEKLAAFLGVCGEIDEVSLDYELGCMKTGFDVLIFMHKNGIRPKKINIHSSHAFGVMRMEGFARTHFPFSEVTVNPLKK